MVAVILIVALVVAGGATGGFLLLGGDDDSDSSGGTLDGDGYSYAIPDGWSDATSAVETQGVDSVVRSDEDDDGFSSNILVEVHPADGVTDPAQIQEEWSSNIAGATDSTPESIDGTTIDGQDALGVRLETEAQDIDVVQFAYLVINDDQIYSIAMSSSIGAEDEATATLQELLGSWTWQSEQGAA